MSVPIVVVRAVWHRKRPQQGLAAAPDVEAASTQTAAVAPSQPSLTAAVSVVEPLPEVVVEPASSHSEATLGGGSGEDKFVVLQTVCSD